jgi:hypothetical protein
VEEVEFDAISHLNDIYTMLMYIAWKVKNTDRNKDYFTEMADRSMQSDVLIYDFPICGYYISIAPDLSTSMES